MHQDRYGQMDGMGMVDPDADSPMFVGGSTASQVTDAGLVHLARLTNLETLYLSGAQVTDAMLRRTIGPAGCVV